MADWLLTLFASDEDAESITGDLLEEFSQLRMNADLAFARRWHWRQTAKTVSSLAAEGLRSAPWKIAAIAIGGFLLRWFVSRLTNPSVERAIGAVLERYGFHDQDSQAYTFWLIHSMYVERFIMNMLVGGAVAGVAKGRELVGVFVLTALSDVLAVQSMVKAAARTGDRGFLWTLPWSFAFSIAVIIGGVIVRRHRSASPSALSFT